MKYLRLIKPLPWLVLAVGFAVTYFLQQAAFIAARQAQQDNFAYHVREITLRIEQRLATYEQVLLGVKGLYIASDIVERNEFHNYVDSLRLENNFPGIQGIGFSLIIPPQEKARHIEAIRKEGYPNYTLRPEGERNLYTSIVFLEPFTGRNLQAFGYDMYSEAIRRAAMERARDLDKSAISGKVTLVQETGQQVQAGFLMYIPVYRNGIPHETLAERRANIIGWVYSPFRMNDLMASILGKGAGDLDIEIYNGEEASDKTLMYDSTPLVQHQHPDLRSLKQISIDEHIWTIGVHPLPSFEAQLNREKPRTIAVIGISMSLLFALLTWLLMRDRERTLQTSEAVARESYKNELLLRTAGDGIHIFDLDGNVVQVNDAFCRMLGYTKEELLGMNVAQWNAQWPAEELKEKIGTTGSSSWVFETQHRRRDGSIIDVEVSTSRVGIDGQQLIYCSARDITERKRAGQILQKRIKELSCLYAVSHDMQENLPIDEVCRRAVVHLALAMQFPEIAVPVLDVKGKRYTSENYTEGLSHGLHAEFKMGEEAFGHLFVFYSEERPFLIPEEQNLINAVAQAFSRWLERNKVESDLIEQEEFFRLTAENVEDFIAVLDLQGRRLYNNPSYTRIFGDTEALKGTDSFAEIHPDDRERIKQVFMETVLSGTGQRADYRFVLADGSIRHMESCGGLIKNSQGEALRVVVVSRDVTARKQADDEIHQLAFYDALTKLPNRRLLNDRLVHTMAACKRSGRYGALMFLDLDNFKPLNDQYGHGVGDLLLVEAARRMSSCVREVDTVARFGGDEFVVVLSELDVDKAESTTQAGIVAEKIRALLAEPFVLKIRPHGGAETPIEHQCTSSIGMVLFINHDASAEDVIKYADKAMYQAKEAGRNQIRFYDAKA